MPSNTETCTSYTESWFSCRSREWPPYGFRYPYQRETYSLFLPALERVAIAAAAANPVAGIGTVIDFGCLGFVGYRQMFKILQEMQAGFPMAEA